MKMDSTYLSPGAAGHGVVDDDADAVVEFGLASSRGAAGGDGAREHSAREEDARDEAVKDAGDEQRHHVEDDEVGEEVGEVLLAWPLEVAEARRRLAMVEQRLGLGQPQPRRAVHQREHPHAAGDALGAVHRAHGVRPHRVADGHVALHRESHQAQRRRVDAQVLAEDEQRASQVAPNPPVACKTSNNFY
jgi:hypothetical protein